MRLPEPNDYIRPQQFGVVGDQLFRKLERLLGPPRRWPRALIRGPRGGVALIRTGRVGPDFLGLDCVGPGQVGGERFQVGDKRPLLGEQAIGLLMLVIQTLPLGLNQPAIVAVELMPLDRTGCRPEQRADGCRVDAQISVGSDLERQRRQFLLAGDSQGDDRLVAAAGPQPLDELQGVEFGRLVADEYGVVNLVAEAGHSGPGADRLFEHDFRSAIGGQRLGQPAAGAVISRDVQHPHPSREHSPDGGHLLRHVERSRGHDCW